MILQVMSDLHLEMHKDEGAGFIKSMDPEGVDVLILAGDISSKSRLWVALDRIKKKYKRVIYVPGNHEYYSGDTVSTPGIIKSACEASGVDLLHTHKVLEIDGKRFLGDTMWFRKRSSTKQYKGSMADFRVIKNLEPWVYEQNEAFVAFLKQELKEGDIVVTHHMPSQKSVHFRWKGHPLNMFFVCEQDDLIKEKKPALWIHGHTHEQCDYMLDSTRVLCNPLGYPHEVQMLNSFNPKLLVTI